LVARLFSEADSSETTWHARCRDDRLAGCNGIGYTAAFLKETMIGVNLGDRFAMKTRPRTSFVMKLKNRRCPKCGGAINSQRMRCKRCHESQGRPKK
jgi:hypothetical protein